ncbi:MAG: DNA mismatch endonuclease Vsr [Actinomycetota bacterium]
MADCLTKEQRSRNMSAIRSTGSQPEQKVAVLLQKVFPRRRIVHAPSRIPGRPDYFLPGLKLAVFVDGCFWHGCPRHGRTPDSNREYWVPKLDANKRRDARRRASLRRSGFSVWRVWEHELTSGAIAVTTRRIHHQARRLQDHRRSA